VDYQTKQFRYDRLVNAFFPDHPISEPILPYEKKPVQSPKARVTSAYSSTVFPNGEFGVGYVKPPKKSAEDARQERGEIIGRTIESAYRLHTLEDGTVLVDSTDDVGRLVPKLGIPVESSQAPKKYGLKGITSHGRKMLRNAGHCLDVAFRSRYGYLCQMGTLTIPSLEPERMRIICQRWGDIVRRFFQECKRRYKKLRLPFHYCSCTEIQPGRWESRREVGLHLHFLFVSVKVSNNWSLPDQWVRDTWRRIMTKYSGCENVPKNLNYRRDAVKQSSAAYIAKYASKGSEFVQEVADEMGEDCIPSQWWSMSASMRKCIKDCTYRSRSEQAELLLHICRHELDEYLRYIRVATIEERCIDKVTGQEVIGDRVIGYGGLLTPVGVKLFQPTDINTRIKGLLAYTLDNECGN